MFRISAVAARVRTALLLLSIAGCGESARGGEHVAGGEPAEAPAQAAQALFNQGLELAVSTGCGDAAGLDPFSGDGDLVQVSVQLENRRNRNVTGNLNVRLRNGPAQWVRPVRGETAVQLAPGSSTTRVFWFRYDDVETSLDAEITLTHGTGTVENETRRVGFACVAACPPFNVMVRRHFGSNSSQDPAVACPRLTGEGGQYWRGAIAAQTTELTYCSYGWQHPDASIQPNLRSFDGIDAANKQVDCPSAAAAGALSASELVGPAGARLGLEAADALLDRASWPLARTSVRLAVVDTAALAFGDTRNDNSEHGRSVGLLANWVACGESSVPCAEVQIDNRLAFPILDVERHQGRWTCEADLARGGLLASQGHIARALHDLLGSWNPTSQPLVLNLSFGWHSKHDCRTPGCGQAIHEDRVSEPLVPDGTGIGYVGGDGEGDGDGAGDPNDGTGHSLGAAAVLISIARARCLGALVVAAAGNAESGRPPGGPLLPAGWNKLDASKLDCGAFGLAGANTPRGPLVYAVGAVDVEGRPIALTRQGSIPPLVALGAGITLRDARRGDAVLGPFGGTSFAAAVVSGSAARLWAHMGPRLRADQVMDALRRAGDPLPGRDEGQDAPSAALCIKGQPCPSPVEINACTLLHAIADLPGAPALPAACLVPRVAPVAPASVLDTTCSPALAEHERRLEQLGASPEDIEALLGTCDEPEVPLPQIGPMVDKLEAAWALPQPHTPGCGTCLRWETVVDSLVLPATQNILEFDRADLDAIVTSAVVQVSDVRIGLPSSLLQTQGAVIGTQQFNLLDMTAAPLLTAEIEPNDDTSLGVPAVVSLELTLVSSTP